MEIEFKPSAKQYEAWERLTDKETKEIGYGGAAHGGKSYLGCFWLVSMCLSYPDTGWLLGRKELTNLKKTTLLTLFKVFEEYDIKPDVHFTYNQQDNIITFINKSQIFLFDLGYKPSDPLYTRLGGLELTGGFVDEANEVDLQAIDILHTRLGRRKNQEYGLSPKLMEGFNPQKNHVYQRFYKPWREGQLPKHRSFTLALPSDNPYTTETYMEQLRNADKVTRERLLMGNFEYDDDPAVLISYDAMTDMVTNTIETEPIYGEKEDKYIVADVARYGRDKTVITVWKSLELIGVHIYEKQGLDTTEEVLRRLMVEEQVPFSHVIIDEDGVGGGIVDNMRGIKGFIANSVPIDNETTHKPENYKSLKSQCAYTLADSVNGHKMSIRLSRFETNTDIQQDKFLALLYEDLEQIKMKDMDKDGKRAIIGKDEVKETLQRSPDYGDTFIMRMWFELNKKKLGSGVASQFYPQRARPSPRPLR